MIKLTKTRHEQTGIVSLLVVTVLAIVLALVAVGFSHLTDRNLRQALDRELSAQAFYSALAGLDDARAYLSADLPDFNTCNGWQKPAGDQYFVSDISAGSNIAKYTCVTINKTPKELTYPIKIDQTVSFKIDSANLDKLYFGWQNSNGNKTALGSIGQLPRESAITPSQTGLLRVSIYPAPSGVTGNADSTIAQQSRTYYFYPDNGPGKLGSSCGQANGLACWTSNEYSDASGPSGSNGSFISGRCNTSNNNWLPITDPVLSGMFCNSAITNLRATGNQNFYVTMTAMYQALNVNVQPADSGNNAIQVPGAQAVVDVTGQGTDVLQRIQARVELGDTYPVPRIQSMQTLCKGFSAEVLSPSQYGPVGLNPTINSYPNNVCQSPNGNVRIDTNSTIPYIH